MYIYNDIYVYNYLYAYDIKETFGGAAYTFTLSFFSAMDRSDRTLILFKTIGDKVNKVPCQFIPTLARFTSQVAFQPTPHPPALQNPTPTTPKASCSNTSATLDAKALAFRRRLDERSMNWSGRSSVGASWCRMGPPLGGLLVTNH